MILNLNIFETPEILAKELADQIMGWIENHTDPSFHMALSGGKTPELLFKALAEKYSDSKLWQIVHFWWVDERMVPPDDPESNYGLVNNVLFAKTIIPQANIHRIQGENDPQEEALGYSKQIQENLPSRNGWPVFDLILLGMGDDGHTASIFPDQLHLLESENICEVAIHPQSGQKRITLTAQTINQAEKVCFVITGANKAQRMLEIWTSEKEAKRLPAAYIHPLNDNLAWYIDQAAAGKIADKIPI